MPANSLWLFVQAVAIGGFHDYIVRLLRHLRITDQRLVVVADVAGKNQLFRSFALGQPQFDAGRSQQVSGIPKTHFHPIAERKSLVIRVRDKQLQRFQCLFCCIQRHIRITALSHCLSIAPLRLEFLNVGAIPQHDFAERTGRRSGVNLAGKSTGIQKRQQPGMVDVGMSQQHVVDLCRRTGNTDVLIGVPSLLHAKIHQNPLSGNLQIGTASGDLVGCTNKRHFHCTSLLSGFSNTSNDGVYQHRMQTKQERQPLHAQHTNSAQSSGTLRPVPAEHSQCKSTNGNQRYDIAIFCVQVCGYTRQKIR